MIESIIKVVVFGTSLTASGGWQEPLQMALADCLSRPVNIVTIAKNGASSNWGVAAVERVVTENPDVVLIEFAINDAALNRFISLKRSRANMTAIIERLSAADSRPRLFVMAMSPVLGLRGFIRPLLSNFIESHRQMARDLGVGFIDHRPAWASLSDAELKAALPDTLHPRPEVAARLMVPVIVDYLALDPLALKSRCDL